MPPVLVTSDGNGKKVLTFVGSLVLGYVLRWLQEQRSKLLAALSGPPALAAPAQAAGGRVVAVGDRIMGSLQSGFPPTKCDMEDLCASRKVLLVGLPGAFTPT